ncbi:T9SS type B sorting domain-containing protein [Chitinophaga oryziterrae]|uniref:T9SS type B sorting domain-containing protein n=1 Tax=Chitinophaga oryziterrae TaxID=1031224 RepID=A0A6N8J928_9BACT|nr:CshA/CshB family fibrillar adhesin-related protein [Chitinophaga oryziterrae]MVT41474.1 T9SS type B sorting domain-containing protein [Chitinophaga oryziterrae]
MKRNSLLILLFLTSFSLKAQYADLGQGTLKGGIWWFDWTGFTIADGASKTFNTTDGLTVKITFSKVTGPIPAPSVMNTWSGAVLHFLYDFSNTSIKPALFAPGQTNNTTFTMQVDATRNGVPTPFTFCAADAEASVINVEATTFITTGGNWRTLQFYRNSTTISNPLTGCGTQTIVITDTQHSNAANAFIPIGQSPLMATDAPSTGTVSVEVHMDKNSYGGMAVAFGILTPVDRGDLPASYGYAAHKISYTESNSCNYDVPFPTVTQDPRLKLGSVLPDADPLNDVDDNITGVDEEAITTFPDYDRSGTYSLNVPLTNTTGAAVYLSGWFDINRNQQFDANEIATAIIPNTATTATLTWTGIPNKPVQGSTKLFGFRFRLSTTSVTTASGLADNGEVEDYLTALKWVCDPLATNITSKATCAGTPVQLNATGNYPTFTWTPAAGLSAVNIANPVATPAANNTYTITATDGDCTQTANIAITVNPLPGLTRSADATICNGTTTQLSAAATVPSGYNWSPATSLDDATIANPVANPQTTTSYTVLATTANGCTETGNITVKVSPVPVITKSPDVIMCAGTGTTLSGLADLTSNYSWSPATGLNNAAIATPLANPVTATLYSVTATTSDGCTSSASIMVDVSAVPSLTKSTDVITCAGTPTQLSVLADIASSYSWLPATGLDDATSSGPLANPLTTTRYVVTATTADGCSIKDSILVKIHQPDVNIITPTSGICKGESAVLKVTGGNTYEWQDADNTFLGNTDQLVVTPASTTTYKLIVTDNICQLNQTMNIPVIVNPAPVTAVKYANPIDCTHPETKLTASGGIQYIWEAVAGIKDLSIPDPVVKPIISTTYHVQVIDANGCGSIDSVTVPVNTTTALSSFPMASAFTPNGDGKNDCFGFKYWGALTVDFNIFNRWGELVFHSTTLESCWDGTYKGEPQPIGTYVYIIRAKTLCGDGERKGTVVLLR